eukprot:Phypoly_transcript_10883.p1 GENE.Phypoly_transcript_10883~~Phypoly_transcript_10883.p1  ORF type:complete len:120 (+),score=19.40 Phypoly_transcript_10883:496-855(+)
MPSSYLQPTLSISNLVTNPQYNTTPLSCNLSMCNLSLCTLKLYKLSPTKSTFTIQIILELQIAPTQSTLPGVANVQYIVSLSHTKSINRATTNFTQTHQKKASNSALQQTTTSNKFHFQ